MIEGECVSFGQSMNASMKIQDQSKELNLRDVVCCHSSPFHGREDEPDVELLSLMKTAGKERRIGEQTGILVFVKPLQFNQQRQTVKEFEP